MARTNRRTPTRRTRRNSQGRRTQTRSQTKRTPNRGPGGKTQRRRRTRKGKPRSLENISSNGDEGRYYGVITKVLGNRVEVRYHGPKNAGEVAQGLHTTMANVALRKGKGKLKLRPNTLVVVELSQVGSTKPARVIHTYRPNEEVQIKRRANFPKKLLGHGSTGSNNIVFA